VAQVQVFAIVISAVVADTIAQAYKLPIIPPMAEYTLVSNWELLLYAILGIAVAFGAIAFTKTLRTMEKLWEKVPVTDFLKPALGGLVLGMIGMITFFHSDGIPRFYGLGYESISHALNGVLPFTLVFSLFFIKILTTSLTLGSGGTGGTFTPSLFMGIMFYRCLCTRWHGCFFCLLVAFEITQYNFHLVLPIMLTAVVATIIAQAISPNSMYTSKLVNLGIKVRRGAPGQELFVMDGITVGEAMSQNVETVTLNMPVFNLMEKFDQSHRHGFPVVDKAGELVGVVSIKDLDTAIAAGNLSRRTVADIATTSDLLVAYPYEPMGAALQRLGVREISRLPVVEEEGSRKLVGIVLRTDIINAYHKALIKRKEIKEKTES